MKVVLRGPQRGEFQLVGRKTVEQILRELGLNPETVIVVRQDELLTRDRMVEESDTIEVISAISGG
jgi:sulfur carrier protein